MTLAVRARGAARETFASLRHRNFRLFFAGQFVSQVGNWLTLVAHDRFESYVPSLASAAAVCVAIALVIVMGISGAAVSRKRAFRPERPEEGRQTTR